MIQLIGLTLIVSLLSGIGLYKQIQANGLIKNELAVANDTVEYMKAERKKLVATLADNTTKKEVIYRDKERIKLVIKEVQVTSAANDCINQPVPVEFNCLFKPESCAELPGNAGTVDASDGGA